MPKFMRFGNVVVDIDVVYAVQWEKGGIMTAYLSLTGPELPGTFTEKRVLDYTDGSHLQGYLQTDDGEKQFRRFGHWYLRLDCVRWIQFKTEEDQVRAQEVALVQVAPVDRRFTELRLDGASAVELWRSFAHGLPGTV